jgi:hypothetical protein
VAWRTGARLAELAKPASQRDAAGSSRQDPANAATLPGTANGASGCSNAPGTCSRHRAAVSCSVGYTNHTRERIARIGPPSIDQDLRR